MSAREIYVITNAVTGQWYIGCSHNAAKRLKRHFIFARATSDYTVHVNIRQYGEDNFSMEVLERCEVEIAGEREQYWLAIFNGNMPGKCLNECDGGGGPILDEARAKISASKIGNKNWLGKTHSEITKDRMSAAMSGKPKSEEHKAKLSIAHLGKKLSEEHKAQLSIAIKGRKHSEEAKARMRKPKPTKTCERCGLVCAAHIYARWHGPNCTASRWKREGNEQLKDDI